jgi:ParB family transcriptional regulator, chromosome partitioning protein
MTALTTPDALARHPAVLARPVDDQPSADHSRPTERATVVSASTPLLLALGAISVQPGFNPRRFFHPERYQALLASVRRHRRIFQNIVVRPQANNPDHFWIVAGERRFRAAIECGLELIPALVLVLTDDEALAIAVAENNDREDISEGEEALLAQRMLHLTRGDAAEAAMRLNWSSRKLEHRLMLSQATDAVLMALAEHKIKLGHAEILSTLPEATQAGTLEDIIARQITVEELRLKYDAFALELSTALFDRAGCQGCPHNTTRQAPLFALGEGRCTNRPCFHSKTVAHLQELRIGLRDEHNALYLDVEREPQTFALLLKSEVGPEQFSEGCKSCAHFGCLLSTRPDSAGRLTRDLCFNLACRAEKIAAYEAQRTEAQADDEGTVSSDETNEENPSHRTTSGSYRHTRKNARNKASHAAAPKRVQERINAIHRAAAAAEVTANKKMTQVYAILALLHELGGLHLDLDDSDPFRARGIQRTASDPRSALIRTLYAREESDLSEIMANLAGRIATKGINDAIHGPQYLKGAYATLHAVDANLVNHFCLDGSFLEVHTKSGIEGLLTEAGFPARYNAQKGDPGAFRRLLASKHADLISEVIKTEFDFKGFVPEALRVPEP